MPIPDDAASRGAETRIGQRHQRGGEGDLGEPVEPVRLLRSHEIERLEGDFGGDPGREPGGIEPGDAGDGGLPAPHAVPESIDAIADSRDGTDAGDGDPPADAHDALFPLVASSSRSTISLMVLRVSLATCSMNRGPMMWSVTILPTRGQGG